MFCVTAAHNLITISRFPSHFSFSALTERKVSTIKLMPLQKKKKLNTRRNTKICRIQFKCLQKTAYSAHQRIGYYHCTTTTSLPRPSNKKKKYRTEWQEWSFWLKNVVESKKEKNKKRIRTLLKVLQTRKKKTPHDWLRKKRRHLFSLVPSGQEPWTNFLLIFECPSWLDQYFVYRLSLPLAN